MIVVTAHPGRTDSRGGHYDRSTGEYHYHHGYSAHQHYDIDGDGKKDCPYNFKDKTNHSNNSSGNSAGDYIERIEKETKYITFEDVLKSIEKIIVITFIIFVLSLCPPTFFIVASIAYLTKKAIRLIKKDLSDSDEERIFTIILVIVSIITVTITSIAVLKSDGII